MENAGDVVGVADDIEDAQPLHPRPRVVAFKNPRRYNAFVIWEPTSTQSWAEVLGLVHVPLFSSDRAERISGSHAVLLDGQRASFAVSAVENPDVKFDADPLSWSWSANVRHLLTIDTQRAEMFLRRWDSPGQMRVFRLPKQGRGAQELLTILEASPAPKAADVILFLLQAFREVRAIFPLPEDSIAILNILLMGTEAVRLRKVPEQDWTQCRTLEDALGFLTPQQQTDAGVNHLATKTRKGSLRRLQDFLLQPEPVTGCYLDPDLLLRHASSQLYQEAHLQLEREQQLGFLFPGFAGDRPHGHLDRDIRYTPTNLARALVQKALKARQERKLESTLRILDPACGSGVFLLEVLRELASWFEGEVIVRGFDKSRISCTITNFCLQRLKRELETSVFRVTISIVEQDALKISWEKPDVVVMNPPFVAWDRMGSDDQDCVREILQDRGKGRMDKAMAFLWKAVSEVEESHGVVATVLPAPLLENQSGANLRESIREVADLRTVGRFEGTGFFASSMVETAFVVLQRKHVNSEHSGASEIQVILAKENHEGAALRAVRINEENSGDFERQGYEVFRAKDDAFLNESWSPRSGSTVRLIASLRDAKISTVGELFDVKQGTITGFNEAFILSEQQYSALPKREQVYFRPLAGNSTIRQGRLKASEYIFYPYRSNGLIINDEEVLKTKVKRYYENYLLPHRKALMARAHATQWWALTWPRSWQQIHAPKLVSTYFGDRGSFAYDEVGEYIVGQGYGWLWRKSVPVATENDIAVSFYESRLPLAYLALLNGPVFERVLDCFCPRMQGGQFNLSTRFVERVFLPDLTDEGQYRGSFVSELARVGSDIQKGKNVDEGILFNLSMIAYKISVNAWEGRVS